MSVHDTIAMLNGKLARGLNIRAEGLRAEIYNVLEQSQHGRGVHYSSNPRRSSAPGDPPARQTGRLQESIAILQRATPQTLEAAVGPRPQSFTRTAPYPVFLEFGTRRMAPRPFVRRGLTAFRSKVRHITAARWGEEPQ